MLAKAKRPCLSFALLVPVAFAPDWIEIVLRAARVNEKAYSHSILSVLIGASLVALGTSAVTRSAANGVVVWLTYASHWAADFITGSKPTWPGGPTVGLMLYNHPVWDIVCESLLVIACWLVYRRSLPADARRRPLGLLMPLGLIAMQVAVASVQTPGLL